METMIDSILILSETSSVSAAREGRGKDKGVKNSNFLRWVVVKSEEDGIFWVETSVLGELGRWAAEILEKDGGFWVEIGC